MMRQRKKKWRLLAVLLCAGIWLQACTPENSVSQIFRERIISGSVDEEQKKQQAQEPVADSRQLEQPKRSQISVGKYAYDRLGEAEQAAMMRCWPLF